MSRIISACSIGRSINVYFGYLKSFMYFSVPAGPHRGQPTAMYLAKWQPGNDSVPQTGEKSDSNLVLQGKSPGGLPMRYPFSQESMSV